MSTRQLEKVLYWVVRAGAYALPFTLLMITSTMFFPFISGKNFAFRIIVELMAAAWAGMLVIDFKKYWPRWSFISVALISFVGIISLSAFFGPDFKQSFWSNFERMEGIITHLHLVLLFFMLAGTFHTRKEWFAFFGVSIFVSVAVASYGLLEATGEIESFADSSRIISTLGNPLYVAAYLSFHIFLSGFLWRETRSFGVRWLLGGVIVFESIVFLLTGARGAFVGILVGLEVIAFLSLITAEGWRKKLVFVGIMGIVLLIPFALYTQKDSSWVQKNSQLLRFANITPQAGSARLIIWGMAWEAFKERPLLGWGAGNFIIPFAKHYDPRMVHQEPWFDRTHNMPLEWLVTGGIMGFLAYLAMFISIIPALVQGVKRSCIENKSAFIFFGMFVAYLIQLLFVFDTLATYITLICMLSFLHVMRSHGIESWLQRNTLVLPSTSGIQSENKNNGERQSKKIQLEMQRRLSNAIHHASPSSFQVVAILGIFAISFLLIAMINIRPIMANRALMSALTYVNQQKFIEAREHFQKALQLSRGTIGTEEAREHMTYNVYTLFQNPEFLKKPEGEALYHMSVEEMKKQVAENSDKNLKIKQNILLAQLYHQWALFAANREALTGAFQQYQSVLQFAPNYVNVYPIAANLYAQTGNMSEALRLIEKVTSLLSEAHEYDAEIFYSKALLYTAAKRYDNAYSALEEISALDGSGGGLDAGMIEHIVKTTGSHGPSAVPFLKRVHELDTHGYVAALMIAQIQAGSGSIDEARLYAHEALRRNASLQTQVDAFLKAIDKNSR